MADQAEAVKIDPSKLCNFLHHTAKFWWKLSIWIKVAAFVIGVVTIFLPVFSQSMPFLMALAVVVAELCKYRYEHFNGLAQGLLRKIDLHDSYGEPQIELADLLVACPKGVKKHTSGCGETESRFASRWESGDTRAAENVFESSWWSYHLSRSMWKSCVLILGLTVSGSIAILVFTLVGVDDVSKGHALYSGIARVVTSLLLLLLSLNLISLIKGYYGFSEIANHVHVRAMAILRAPKIKTNEPKALWYEYHIARATAPTIPDWIYNLKKGTLNNLFELKKQEISRPAPSRK